MVADRVFLADLPKHVGDRVVVHGWLAQVRRTSRRSFLSLRDRSGVVQVVHGEPSALAGVGIESALRVAGRVRACAAERWGPVEIEAERVEVLAQVDGRVPSTAGAGPEER